MSSRRYDPNEISTRTNDLDIKHRKSDSVEFSKFLDVNKNQRNSVAGEPHKYWTYRKRTSPLMPAEDKHTDDSVNQAMKIRKPSFGSISEIYDVYNTKENLLDVSSTKSNSENSKNISESDIEDSEAHKYWTYWKRHDPKAHKYWTYWKRNSSLKQDNHYDDIDTKAKANTSHDKIPNYELTHWTYSFLDQDMDSDDNNANASDDKISDYELTTNQNQRNSVDSEPHKYWTYYKRNSSLFNQDKDSVDAKNKVSNGKSFNYHQIENVRSPNPNLLDRNQKQKDGFVAGPHKYGRFNKRSSSMQTDNEGSEIFTPMKKIQYENENNINSASKQFPTGLINIQPFIDGKPLLRLGQNFPRKTSIFRAPKESHKKV